MDSTSDTDSKKQTDQQAHAETENLYSLNYERKHTIVLAEVVHPTPNIRKQLFATHYLRILSTSSFLTPSKDNYFQLVYLCSSL